MKYLIEQKVWDYLDGLGNTEERIEMERLIQSDPDYQAAHESLSEINNSLVNMDTEQPSLAFTRNVMDQLKGEPVPGSVKSLVDKRIISGLFFFFLTSIVILLAILLIQIEWGQSSQINNYSFQLPVVNFSSFINDWTIKGFYFVDAVIILYFFDHFLRRKNKQNEVI